MDIDSSSTNGELTAPLDNVLDQLRALVSEEPTDADPTLVQIRSAALFARLKNLTRSANAAPRLLRQATLEVRQEADQAFLSMQELLYEKRHLEREIEKCRAFGSIYQDIPIYDVDTFKELSPPEAHSDDPHQFMLNRLSFELAERQRLDTKRKELLQQREELIKQKKAITSVGESVKTQIDNVVKAATTAQQNVEKLPLPS